MVSSARPVRLTRAAFRVFRPVTTRWSDNDMFGHVNNVVYYAWFDTAVTGWLVGNGLLDPLSDAAIPVVAETACAYFASVAFPEAVEMGLAVERVGRSSITYRLAVFRAGEADAAAQGRFTHVYVARNDQTPVEVPTGVRAACGDLLES